jgi:hypothetical protein
MGESHMMKHETARRRPKAPKQRRLRKAPKLGAAEEELLRKATIYLLRKHGHLLVATAVREQGKGSSRWIFSVTLRYPTGHEGYVGDLLYDGKDFCFLTPPQVRKQRIQAIAADPERDRRWNEYRSPPLQPRKR